MNAYEYECLVSLCYSSCKESIMKISTVLLASVSRTGEIWLILFGSSARGDPWQIVYQFSTLWISKFEDR